MVYYVNIIKYIKFKFFYLFEVSSYINKTNSSVLKVRVHKGEKTEDINLRLERGDKGAYIELLENESGK